MSTYPRTYDLIHADSVFSLYNDRYTFILCHKLIINDLEKEKIINDLSNTNSHFTTISKIFELYLQIIKSNSYH